MSKTRQQVIEKVLFLLGVADGGVSAEDSEKVDRNIDPASDLMAGLGIYNAGDVGQIGPTGGTVDEIAFLPFCNYVADFVADEFGMGGQPILVARRAEAEDMLRTLAAPARNRKTLRIDPALRFHRRYYDGRVG